MLNRDLARLLQSFLEYTKIDQAKERLSLLPGCYKHGLAIDFGLSEATKFKSRPLNHLNLYLYCVVKNYFTAN